MVNLCNYYLKKKLYWFFLFAKWKWQEDIVDISIKNRNISLLSRLYTKIRTYAELFSCYVTRRLRNKTFDACARLKRNFVSNIWTTVNCTVNFIALHTNFVVHTCVMLLSYTYACVYIYNEMKAYPIGR